MIRELYIEIQALLRPIRNKIQNTVARATVTAVNKAAQMQLLQLEINKDEIIPDVEHFQPYGFKSVPKADAESVVVFVGGDRNQPVAVVTDDRTSRPVGWAEGDVGVYNEAGASIRLVGNDIEVSPATGGLVYVRQPGGTVERLVTLSEHNDHIHNTGVGTSTTPVVPAVGTEKLRA